jgi:Protein of unknown function (DUF3071)
MRNLRLVGLSSDGRQVVYVDDAGVECLAPADERLRAALRGDRARLGQLEIEMDSALRPRDIQARIRAGDTPDSVAALAAVPVERIMAYCVPVLAERRHVAETAGRSHVRRANADGQSRRLGDVVAERLRGRGVDPETVEWDAWRRDDARWTVLLTYLSGESVRAAHFVFDQSGRYSLADDDEARWLTGERQSTVHGPQPRDHSPTAGDRRLAVVPRDDDDLLSLAPDDLGVAESHDYFTDESYAETSDDLTAVVRAVREGSGKAVAADAEAADDAADGVEVETAPQDDADQAVDDHSDTAADEPAEPQRRKRANRRASVPSWDEIMLGRRAEK